MNVYQAICAVQADVAKVGVKKDRENVQQKFLFRGIDDVYNALAPLLAKHQLCIIPRATERSVSERINKSGNTLIYTALAVEYDFVAAEDGSKHTVRAYGEAMDSGDKSTIKAMSAAYKSACLQTFCIPTEGDNDADATHHEISATNERVQKITDALGAAKTTEERKRIWRAGIDACTSANDEAAIARIRDYRASMPPLGDVTESAETPPSAESAPPASAVDAADAALSLADFEKMVRGITSHTDYLKAKASLAHFTEADQAKAATLLRARREELVKAKEAGGSTAPSYSTVANLITKAKTQEDLETAQAMIEGVESLDHARELVAMLKMKRQGMSLAA